MHVRKNDDFGQQETPNDINMTFFSVFDSEASFGPNKLRVVGRVRKKAIPAANGVRITSHTIDITATRPWPMLSRPQAPNAPESQ